MSLWSSRPIRVRLTAWYAAVMLLTLVAYASATYVAVRHEFLEQLDDELHDDFETAEGFLAAAPDGRIVWSHAERRDIDDPPDDPDEVQLRRTDVWSATGEAIYSSAPAAGLPSVVVPADMHRVRYETVVANGHLWRTLTGPSPVAGRSVVLRVARSEERLRQQLWEVLTVLVFGLPLTVVLAGVGGYVLAHRALAPIDAMGSEARRITADNLHERLSVPNEADEIGRLAAVINQTFARLEASFQQLRRFTADASHELRTPLSVIRGIGEVGLEGTHTPAEYKETIGSMLEEVDRLTTLVDTLLRLSRGDAGTVRVTREAVDLGQLARDIVSSLGILAEERRQRVVLDVADRVIVSADRLVLREAITNVLDNAIAYGPEGSSIDVRITGHRDQAVLTIADRGPGIPAEHRDRIFDRFYRIDEGRSRERGGTGLGLAIAKWAVEVNGGRISVEDATTGGAVFRIVLPVAAPSGHREIRMEGNV